MTEWGISRRAMQYRHLYGDAPLRTLLFGRRRGLCLTHPPGRRRAGLAAVAGAAFLAAVAGVLGLAWRLSQGPISLDALTPRIEETLNRAFGGRIGISLGGVSLDTGGTMGLRFRAEDVRLRDHDGRPLGRIQEAEFGFDPAALLLGEVRIRRLALVAPVIRVRRMGGSVDVLAAPRSAAPADAPSTDAVRPTPDALGTVAAGLDAALRLVAEGAGGLETLRISNAELDYADESGGRLRLPDLSAELKHTEIGPVTLDFALGPPASRMRGVLQAWDDDGRREIQGRLDGLRLHGLGIASREPGVAAFARQPLTLAFVVPLTRDGVLGAASATLEGASFDSPADAAQPFRGAVRLRLDPAAKQVVVEPSRVGIERGFGTVSGNLFWQSGNQGEIAIRLNAEGLRFDHVAGADPLDVRSLAFAGAGFLKDRSIRIDRLMLDSDRARASIGGLVALGDRSPGIRVQGEGSADDISALKQIWPPFVAP
ncbi:MAG: hypothetical protein M3145_06075, partial [Pseudomonadota bacterium]|nr:hypothetical protein [Pseudomonadota bacterium]